MTQVVRREQGAVGTTGGRTVTGNVGLDLALERDRLVRLAVAEVSKKSWGKALTPAEQVAVARYALEAGLDPARHLNVMGGNIYVNSEAYLDKLADDPDFEELEYINITENPELRRFWHIPERATAAYECRIRHRGRTFIEASYAPKTTKDDVGRDFPGEKARQSALRRAARMCIPIWSRRLQRIQQELQVLHAEVKSHRGEYDLADYEVADHPLGRQLPAPVPEEEEPPTVPATLGQYNTIMELVQSEHADAAMVEMAMAAMGRPLSQREAVQLTEELYARLSANAPEGESDDGRREGDGGPERGEAVPEAARDGN